MQRRKCQECGSEHPRGEIIRLNEKLLCQACAKTGLARLQAAAQPVQATREVDPTICTQCKTDHGSTTLPTIGEMPFCGSCSQSFYDRPFPGWLKGSMAALLVLLVFALWHGQLYFHAGKALARGERALQRHEYRLASADFEEVLKVTPTGEDAILLAAKSYLLSGDIAAAGKVLDRRQNYDNNLLYKEVDGLWTRASGAWEKASQAAKLADAGKEDEASRLMAEAAKEYPESSDLAQDAIAFAGAAAFEQKDYDAFLDLSRKALQMKPQDPESIAMVGSALACKYAVTGDPMFRTQAEEMLAQAQSLSGSTPELKSRFEEYSERIRYRLDSREIISRKEYDRRFRKTAQDARKGNS